MTDTQPVLPATPWWESEVQVRAVIAIAGQGVSLVFRTLPMLGLNIDVSHVDLDGILANITQGLAVWFAALAIIKRQKSAVAPLTLTTGGAALHTVQNPPLLDSDPTKLPKETKSNA